jgi:glycosyltransferase involved in cell wall biosynthesis
MNGVPPSPEPGPPSPPGPQDGSRPRVLFICADAVGTKMAGLGIRCWELARALSDVAAVTVAHGGSERREADGVRTVPFRVHAPRELRELIAAADTVIAHPQWPVVDRWLQRAPARVVIDLYCPETLETLELMAGRRALVRRAFTDTTIDRLHTALRTGDHFICASESQRDLWLGTMLALRLIGPELYDRDPSLRDVIDLVPFGVPAEPPPRPTGDGPRELLAGLGSNSEIVLWNGGIWSWLDAPTAIRAVARLAERRPGVRLLFMGVNARHPAAARSTQLARDLARDLGVLGSVVHFHEGWIPYTERAMWLGEAACAISTHADHLETRFAYRTRLLDCFWSGLPVVCTTGDELADRVSREDLGAVAAPGDPDGLAHCLAQVLDRGRESYAPQLRAAAERQTWQRVAQPLRRWISGPPPPPRAGTTAGALRVGGAQRLREAAYLAGGRVLLARRARAAEDR